MDGHATATFHRPSSNGALANEPGFRDLPPQTQQAMQNRLTQLNNMPPDQRRRLFEHAEAMEQLTPPQRQQVRGAIAGYPVRCRSIGAEWLRVPFAICVRCPQPQRQAVLSSDQVFAGSFRIRSGILSPVCWLLNLIFRFNTPTIVLRTVSK